jgi:cyclase
MVKTVKFEKPQYLGDPVNAVKIFNNKGVDELSVLDISATKLGKLPDFKLLKDIATEAFMPLSYGGGITTIEQIRELFSIGYEKVVINSALVRDPDLIRKAVAYAGCQSIVASIDIRYDILGRPSCYIAGGTKNVNISPIDLAKKAEELGVGEVLLGSINRDGEMKGYDIKLIKQVVDAVSIPVIACGGAGSIEDIKSVLEEGHAHAAAAGSFFVYYGRNRAILITAPTEEDYIRNGIYSNN